MGLYLGPYGQKGYVLRAYKPLVTIVMAVYNGETFLAEQLQSIVDQDYPKFELLIADEGSSDSSYEIAASYAERHDWIGLSQNRERLGLIKNFEHLLEKAEGEYIAFCDQDDVWHSKKLSRSVEVLEREKCDDPILLHSDLAVVNEKLEPLSPSFFDMRSYRFGKERQLDAMLGRCGVMGNTMVINQKLKSMVLPFPEHLTAHDYWIALINELFGRRITLQEKLVDYRIHSANTSNHSEKIKSSRCRLSACLRREYRIPYVGMGRESVLSYLLEYYSPQAEDRKKVHTFIDYLEFKKSRFELIRIVLRNDFFRGSRFYRLKVAWKVLWKKR